AKLMCDPLGYLWQYGFGWSAPDETDEPLTLDPLAFGNLLHEILQGAIGLLEEKPGGFASAEEELRGAIAAAGVAVAARWDQTMPVPPPVIWRRKREEAAELALVALSTREDPLTGSGRDAENPLPPIRS